MHSRRIHDFFFRLLFVLLVFRVALADSFTNPPTIVKEANGSVSSTTDLSTVYTFGQTVLITWNTSIQTVSLSLRHWDPGKAAALTSLLSKCFHMFNYLPHRTDPGYQLATAPNTGQYRWIIGADDGIGEQDIRDSPNFVLDLLDPTGTAEAQQLNGFVNNVMTSRGFIIKLNDTASTSAPTNTHTSLPSDPVQVADASQRHSKVNYTAKAAIIATVVVILFILFALTVFLFFRRRKKYLVREITERKLSVLSNPSSSKAHSKASSISKSAKSPPVDDGTHRRFELSGESCRRYEIGDAR
jgi:hypothetical protein